MEHSFDFYSIKNAPPPRHRMETAIATGANTREITANHRETFDSKQFLSDIQSAFELLTQLGFAASPSDPLPPHAASLSFDFALQSPYFSKDDRAFYPCPNSIRKEWCFLVPMVSPSTWKGNLRLAAYHAGVPRSHRNLLFGPRDASQDFQDDLGAPGRDPEKLFEGRLHFFPSYFSQIALDVINRIDRFKRTGTFPIFSEIVPPNAVATFSLLYFPYDLLGKPPETLQHQIALDLHAVASAVKTMFQVSGFGAKKTLGAGKAAISRPLDIRGVEQHLRQELEGILLS